MADRKPSRGIRNNNPGNIRKSKDKWQGLATEQPDAEFFSFKDPTWGIRAMARVLINYDDEYELKSIRAIIRRWAPEKGDRNGAAAGGEYTQNTNGYITAVSEASGFGPTEQLDMHKFEHLFPVLKAMIKHENGYNPYTDAQITRGLILAGVKPVNDETIQKDRVVKGAQVVGLTATAAEISRTIEDATPALSLAHTMAEYAPIALTIAVIAGVAYIVYVQWDKHRKGLN